MLRRIVLSFVGKPRTVGEIAAQAGADLKRLHHHVTKLHGLQLLEAGTRVCQPADAVHPLEDEV